MERIFGYHNWPGLETGTVMLHHGPIMGAAANFTIHLQGVAGHAAMPHLTADPVQAAAHLIVAFNSIVARNANPQDPVVISTTMLEAGQAKNQIAEVVTIGGTFRALTPEVMQLLDRRIREVSEHTASAFGVKAKVEISGYLPPTINHKAEADLAAQAAADAGFRLLQRQLWLSPRLDLRQVKPGALVSEADHHRQHVVQYQHIVRRETPNYLAALRAWISQNFVDHDL
jgi:hippurate hydrolase